MARQFDVASSELLQINSAVVAAAPFAVVAWVKLDQVPSTGAGDEYTAVAIADASSANFFYLRADDATDKVNWNTAVGGAGSAVTSTTVTAAWEHWCGIEVSSTDRRVLLNAGGKGTNATDKTPANLDNTTIGAINTNSVTTDYIDGAIAEVAIWDLSNWPGATDSDKADNFETILSSLTKGFSPLFFPLGLIAYWPLIRDVTGDGTGNDNDIVGGNNMSPTNTPTISAHPRVIYPSVIWTPSGEVAAPVGAAGIMTTNTGYWGPTF